MSMRSVRFYVEYGRDIHVLRGRTTPDLRTDHLLVVDHNGTIHDADDYLAANPGDSITFTPRFRKTLDGNLWKGVGTKIRVHRRSGVVSFAAGAPARVQRNFLIEAQGRNADGSTTNIAVIRVQVHRNVTEAWLTPAVLTVRPSSTALPVSTQYRFTVRAQFDDGVVGDITAHHGVTWGPAAHVESSTGRLRVHAGEAVGAEFEITATLPASLGGLARKARMRIGRSNVGVTTDAHIVVGGAWPGTIRPEVVPNVLILGDGFQSDAAFRPLVDKLVARMKTNRLSRPFDLLCSSMNFWRTFVAAPVAGISVRSEVYTYTNGAGKLVAKALPEIIRPPAAGAWDIEHLLFEVGLPVDGDEADARTPDVLRAEWAALAEPAVAATINDPSIVSDDIIDEWKELANRRFVEEIDAFPGMEYGGPPAAQADDNYTLGLHGDRLEGDELREFLKGVRATNGVKLDGNRDIGALWTSTNPAFNFDNRSLLVLFSSFPGGLAVNTGDHYIAISTKKGRREIPVIDLMPARKELKLGVISVPTSVEDQNARTMIHELAHSFGCGDEYAQANERFRGVTADLDDDANLQDESSVRRAGDIHGDEIKWRWHRITKAAVVEAKAVPDGANFLIAVSTGHGFRFSENDQVLLRERKWGTPLLKVTHTLANDKLLQVVGPREASRVRVKPAPGSTATLADVDAFGPGSILYMPTPAPGAWKTSAYPFAEMVAPNIKQHITTTKLPLTKRPPDPVGSVVNGQDIDGGETQPPRLDGVVLPSCTESPRIIGLYEGGDQLLEGIFHPAGKCMMRESNVDDAEFCFVCRYILVDMIDPSRHSTIDREYGAKYPAR
jgi:hypothetical protein